MIVVNGLTESASAAMVYPGLKFLITSNTQMAKIRSTLEAVGAKREAGLIGNIDNMPVPGVLCCRGEVPMLYGYSDRSAFGVILNPQPLIEAVLHDCIIMLKTELDALHSMEPASCSDDAQIESETDWKFKRYATLLEHAVTLAKRKQKPSPAFRTELIRLMDSL